MINYPDFLNCSDIKKKSYISIEAGLVTSLGFWTGHEILVLINPQFSNIGGFLSMICAICILHPAINTSIASAKKRFNSSLIGFFFSGLTCFCFGYGYLQLFIAIALSVLTTRLIKYYEGTRIAAAQAGIVVVLGIVFPHFTLSINVTTRFLETIAGLVIGLAALWLSYQLGIRTYQTADAHEYSKPKEVFS